MSLFLLGNFNTSNNEQNGGYNQTTVLGQLQTYINETKFRINLSVSGKKQPYIVMNFENQKFELHLYQSSRPDEYGILKLYAKRDQPTFIINNICGFANKDASILVLNINGVKNKISELNGYVLPTQKMAVPVPSQQTRVPVPVQQTAAVPLQQTAAVPVQQSTSLELTARVTFEQLQTKIENDFPNREQITTELKTNDKGNQTLKLNFNKLFLLIIEKKPATINKSEYYSLKINFLQELTNNYPDAEFDILGVFKKRNTKKDSTRKGVTEYPLGFYSSPDPSVISLKKIITDTIALDVINATTETGQRIIPTHFVREPQPAATDVKPVAAIQLITTPLHNEQTGQTEQKEQEPVGENKKSFIKTLQSSEVKPKCIYCSNSIGSALQTDSESDSFFTHFCSNELASVDAIIPNSSGSQSDTIKQGDILNNGCRLDQISVDYNPISNNLYYQNISTEYNPEDHKCCETIPNEQIVLNYDYVTIKAYSKGKGNFTIKGKRLSRLNLPKDNWSTVREKQYKKLTLDELQRAYNQIKTKNDFENLKKIKFAELFTSEKTQDEMVTFCVDKYQKEVKESIKLDFFKGCKQINDSIRGEMVLQYRLYINNKIRNAFGIAETLFGYNKEIVLEYENSLKYVKEKKSKLDEDKAPNGKKGKFIFSPPLTEPVEHEWFNEIIQQFIRNMILKLKDQIVLQSVTLVNLKDSINPEVSQIEKIKLINEIFTDQSVSLSKLINSKIENDVFSLVDDFKSIQYGKDAVRLVDLQVSIGRKRLNRFKLFDKQRQSNPNLHFEEKDEKFRYDGDNLILDQIETPKLKTLYDANLLSTIKIVYALESTKDIRQLKQHLIVEPSIIDYTMETFESKTIINEKGKTITKKEKVMVKNIETMFGVIKCLKFWFDVYVEGLFYNLIYPGNNNERSTIALTNIKTQLLKSIKQSEQDSFLGKLQQFERDINKRKTELEKQRTNFNLTKTIYKLLEYEKAALLAKPKASNFIEQISKKEISDRENRLEQISRITWSPSIVGEISKKIGTKNKISEAIKATKNQALVDRYMNGDTTLKGEEVIKVNNLIKFTGFEPKIIDDMIKRNKKYIPEIAAVTDLPIIASSAADASPVTAAVSATAVDKKKEAQKMVDLYKNKVEFDNFCELVKKLGPSYVMLREIANIIKPNFIRETEANAVSHSDSDTDSDSESEVKDPSIQYSVTNIGKLPAIVVDYINAKNTKNVKETKSVITRLNQLVENFKKLTDTIIENAKLYEKTDGSKSDKTSRQTKALNDIIKEIFPEVNTKQERKDKAKEAALAHRSDQTIIESNPVTTAEVKIVSVLPRERIILPTDGTFVLDEWQKQFIATIKETKSCLLTTPTGVGKTFTMMTCIDELITIINADPREVKPTITYVAPSIQLAIQTFANIKQTNSEAIQVSLITETIVYNAENPVIYVGTPIALANYFDSSDKTFEFGLFDEIHLILPEYARNIYERIRIKETVKLIGRCTRQFIGASATISNVGELNTYIQSKCAIPNSRDNFVSPIQFDLIEPKPVLPEHIEHVFNGSEFQEIKRKDSTGNVDEMETLNRTIDGTESVVSIEKFIELIKTVETQPALVFEKSEIHAYASFEQIVNKLEETNSVKYPNKKSLAYELRLIVLEANRKVNEDKPKFHGIAKKTNNKIKPFFETQRNYVKQILDKIREKVCDIIMDLVKNEEYTKLQKEESYKQNTKQHIENILKFNLFYGVDKITNAFKGNPLDDKVDKKLSDEYGSIITYVVGNGRITAELLEIIEVFNKYYEYIKTYEGKFGDNPTIRFEVTDYVIPLPFYLLSIGNEYRFINNNSLSQSLINGYNLIVPLNKNLIDAENIKISKLPVLDANDEPTKNTIDQINNINIKKICELYILGAEYGATCIIPNLPWFIQIEVMKSISVSNGDNPEVGFVFTSQDMSIGIDYPLRSVIVKAPNGTPLNSKNTFFEPSLLIQMSGRCGRRSTSGNERNGMIYYYGISNYNLANRMTLATDIAKKIAQATEEAKKTATEEVVVQPTLDNEITKLETNIIPDTTNSQNIIGEIFAMSLSEGTKNIVTTLNDLPIVRNLDKVNSWLSAFNQPSIKHIFEVRTDTEKVRFGLGIVINNVLLIDQKYRGLTPKQQYDKYTNTVETIYNINNSQLDNINIDQIEELNQLIEHAILLIFNVYNSNRKVKLDLDTRKELKSIIQSLIQLLHNAEIILLNYSARLIERTHQISSPAREGLNYEPRESNFSLLSFLLSSFN